MKKRVPFRRQVVPVDDLQVVEWMLQAGETPSREQIVKAVKRCYNTPLPRLLLNHLLLILTGKIKAKAGRKPISGAWERFREARKPH